ncbi:MAG: glycosyltransferase, partial [Elusimicrobiota bacterium]
VFSFIHVAGFRDFRECRDFYQREGLLDGAGLCLEYLEDMGSAYRASDLVVSRAGAMTCLELLEFRRRCLLIPLARSTEAHQWANARCLEQLGIAKILEEGLGLDARLDAAIKEELANPRRDEVAGTAAPRPTLAAVAQSLISGKLRAD